MQKVWKKPAGSRRRQSRRRRGMTLVEIMAVLVIIGLIATMVGIAVLPRIKDARIKATRADAQAVAAAATMYMADNEGCPTVEQLVEAKILDKNKKTKDAWNHDFVIECDEDGPVAKSAGPDGQMGTDDDIY